MATFMKVPEIPYFQANSFIEQKSFLLEELLDKGFILLTKAIS